MSGFSPEKLARIPAFLQAQIDSGALPGGKPDLAQGRIGPSQLQGRIDLERGAPMREDAIFRLYSMTKPVTVVALLMLLEQARSCWTIRWRSSFPVSPT